MQAASGLGDHRTYPTYTTYLFLQSPIFIRQIRGLSLFSEH
jgi:hypothetical protein